MAKSSRTIERALLLEDNPAVTVIPDALANIFEEIDSQMRAREHHLQAVRGRGRHTVRLQDRNERRENPRAPLRRNQLGLQQQRGNQIRRVHYLNSEYLGLHEGYDAAQSLETNAPSIFMGPRGNIQPNPGLINSPQRIRYRRHSIFLDRSEFNFKIIFLSALLIEDNPAVPVIRDILSNIIEQIDSQMRAREQHLQAARGRGRHTVRLQDRNERRENPRAPLRRNQLGLQQQRGNQIRRVHYRNSEYLGLHEGYDAVQSLETNAPSISMGPRGNIQPNPGLINSPQRIRYRRHSIFLDRSEFK
ncbi:hypothetical protein HNY73_005256 [Argiope bruennichi]|uniref:Uncharacterized protein n=1 Tax=Argiope bruennichi TaxID=94029 RepID=A0A8T0FII3_ARGBR|nr:hypothetical protein HNY73_005256 [Argiope bruennichi]